MRPDYDVLMATNEPDRLQRGKALHKEIQADWVSEAEGKVKPEKEITKPSGRSGRIDVPKAVRKNARRYARQLWNYIEAELETGVQVSPGIIFSRRPKTPGRLEEVERLFDEAGIPVVWQDETG